MIAFIIKRILIAIPVLVIVVSATFLLVRSAPGSPFDRDRALSPLVEKRLNEKYGLDGTVISQLGRYWWRLLQGDLGDSTKYANRTIADIIGQTLPNSAILGFGALTLALLIGVALGTYAAVHHNAVGDRAAMLAALAGICLPSFLIAPLFVLLFAILLPLFPVAGWGMPAHYILPVLCLALPYGAYCARLMRTSMLEVLNQDFVRTARAKGLPEKIVVYKHALKTAILPLVSFSGPLAAHVLTGSLIIESIFKIPGMGTFFVNAVIDRDVFLIAGAVIVYSSLLIAMNILVDVLYVTLDRRVKLW